MPILDLIFDHASNNKEEVEFNPNPNTLLTTVFLSGFFFSLFVLSSFSFLAITVMPDGSSFDFFGLSFLYLYHTYMLLYIAFFPCTVLRWQTRKQLMYSIIIKALLLLDNTKRKEALCLPKTFRYPFSHFFDSIAVFCIYCTTRIILY